MQTILEILGKTSDYFAVKGVPKARLDAEHLMAHVLGLKRMELYMQYGRPMTESDLDRLRPLVRRRGQREPLQYILGNQPFCDADLVCRAGSLIPRPETEELVERAVEKWGNLSEHPPQRIVDLGTGSGAIAIAMAMAFPSAEVLAVDTSPEAEALTLENAESNGVGDRVRFARSDWWQKVEGTFDIILSNPPYLTQYEVDAAEPEVRGFEPWQALIGRDPSGAGDLLEIIETSVRHRSVEGPALLGLETGIDQHSALLAAVERAGWSRSSSDFDLDRRPRYIWGEM